MGKQEQIQRDAHISGQSNEPLSKPAHALCFQTVIEETGANPQDGLTSAEAKRRLERFGRNELGDTGSVQPVRILLRQFANAMTLVIPSPWFEWTRALTKCADSYYGHGGQFRYQGLDRRRRFGSRSFHQYWGWIRPGVSGTENHGLP